MVAAGRSYLEDELARVGRGGTLPISLNLFLRLVPESAGGDYRGRPRWTVAETIEQFRAYQAVGVTEIAAFLPSVGPEVFLDQARILGREVVPEVRAG